MGKYSIFVGVLASIACLGARAESSLQVYGVLDVGVEYLTNKNRSTSSGVGMNNNNVYGSRFGFRGREDLGNGWYAFFNLESGISPKDGSLLLGGRMFGRESALGLGFDRHEVRLGRLLSPLLDNVNRFDPTTFSQYALISHDAALSARGDHAIRYSYRAPTWSASAFYSLGSDTLARPIGGAAGDLSRTKDLALSWTYQTEALAIGLTYDNLHGPLTAQSHGVGFVLPSRLPARSAPGDSAKRFVVGVQAKTGPVVFRGGVRLLEATSATGAWPDARSSLYWAGVVYSIRPQTRLIGAVYRQDVRDSGARPNSVVGMAQNDLSKRTMLYIALSRMRNSGGSALGVDPAVQILPNQQQFGAQLGMSHFF